MMTAWRITALSSVLLLGSTPGCGQESDYYGLPAAPYEDDRVPLTDPVQVTRVVDGDTFDIVLDGTDQSVRMKGIDTPELRPNGPYDPEECAEAAREFTFAHIGTAVDLVYDSRCGDNPLATCRDAYNRILAYVRLSSGSDLGALLLRQGLARVYRFNGEDFDSRVAYEDIQDEAEAANAGAWGTGCP
jgi:micrococcal nuclease